jgi:hypothetical protein
MRCAFLAALVFLFTRPYRYTPASNDLGQNIQKAVIILDATMSMQAAHGAGRLFDKAKSEAGELLRRLDDTEAAVVLLKAKPESILPVLSRNIPMLYRSLQETRPSYESGVPTDALALAQSLLSEKSGGTIYIFSDFQKTQWQNAFSKISRGISVVIRPMVEGAIENLAVTDIRVHPFRSVAGEPVEIEATLFNGTAATRRIPVRMSFFGETQTSIIDAPAYSSMSVLFTVESSVPGEFEGHIRIDRDDALAPDDIRYFKVAVRPEAHILVIGDDSPQDPEKSTFYMVRAVVPSARHRHGLNVFYHHSQDVHVHALNKADALIIASPAFLSRDIAQSIDRKVREGSVLICSLNGADAHQLVDLLADGSGGGITPPFTILSPASDVLEGTPLRDIDYRHHPLKLFRGSDNDGLSVVRFQRHLATAPVEHREDEVRMRHGDGSAAFSVSSVGEGTVIFMNFPLTPEGGNLVTTPLFPVLIHESLKTGGDRSASRETEPGLPWELWIANVENREPVVRGPDHQSDGQSDDQPVPYHAFVMDERMRLNLEPVSKPGVYRVHINDQVFAYGIVNPNAGESDLRPMLPSQLAGTDTDVPNGRAHEKQIIVRDKPLHLSEAISFRKYEEIWPWMGLAALFFLSLEMGLLAFWPGPTRRSRG